MEGFEVQACAWHSHEGKEKLGTHRPENLNNSVDDQIRVEKETCLQEEEMVLD